MKTLVRHRNISESLSMESWYLQVASYKNKDSVKVEIVERVFNMLSARNRAGPRERVRNKRIGRSVQQLRSSLLRSPTVVLLEALMVTSPSRSQRDISLCGKLSLCSFRFVAHSLFWLGGLRKAPETGIRLKWISKVRSNSQGVPDPSPALELGHQPRSQLLLGRALIYSVTHR